MKKSQRLYQQLKRTFADMDDQSIAARVGVSKGTMSNWKDGAYEEVSPKHIFACADAMGMNRVALLIEITTDGDTPKGLRYDPEATPP